MFVSIKNILSAKFLTCLINRKLFKIMTIMFNMIYLFNQSNVNHK
ncbi:hypothetical protein HMPREF0497_0934 [Lentilactobacillus buchneri ATCC 11577]|nr:hypothetical protein HMPREF0497_0934 [Lentilactobacillus buchneri ATCC 11577]